MQTPGFPLCAGSTNAKADAGFTARWQTLGNVCADVGAHVQAVIQANEAFSYTGDLRPLAAIPGTFLLSISTRFAGAKNPNRSRVVFQVTLDRAGLLALRNVIDSGVL
jgi:hypothetical protein